MALSAEVIPYALPFRAPYVTATGRLKRREMVLFRLRDDDGVEGFGEAVPLSLRGGTPIDRVISELEAWTPGAQMREISAPARCAIATAYLDLESRREGIPAWRWLGASAAAPVSCNATLPLGDPARIAERALDWAQEGFTTFKLKVGSDADVAQVRAVRDALGPQAAIRVDANGTWTPQTARSVLAALEPIGIELAEQPVATLGDLAELRRVTTIPLAADESVADAEEAARAARIGACDMATAKLSKLGGPDVAAIAEHLPVYLSSALDGPVGIAAAAHTAQALRESGRDAGVAHGLATQRLFAETIAVRECELRDGFLHLPDGPGLGVEIDLGAVEPFRL